MLNPTQFNDRLVQHSPRSRALLRGAALLVSLAGLTGAVDAVSSDAIDGVRALKQMSIEELMDIEVTSVSRHAEKLSHAASAIQVITQDEIRRSGATSIPEALRLADNLDVAQQNSHQWAISARGFNTELANKLLVQIDGRTVYTPLFSGVFWDVQNYLLEDIDRIEVVSGPGGSLWGANAVNGVINITTKNAQATQGLYLEAGGGSQLRGSTALRYGGRLAQNVYYRVYGQFSDWGNQTTTAGPDATDDWRIGQGGFRIDAGVSPDDTFTLQGDYYTGDENLVGGGSSKVGGGNLLGRWSRRFTAESDMSLQVYYSRTHLAQPVAALLFAPAGILTDDLDTYDLDFQHRFRLSARQRVVWGLGYRFTHDVVGNAPALALFPPTLNQTLYSGFVQDEIALHENLTLTLGTKVEHNSYTGVEVEPSVRLEWHVTPRQMFWAAASRAVRTPSRLDRNLSQPDPAYLLVILKGSDDFTSEKVNAYELGYRAQLGSRATVAVSTFFNDYHDVRSASTSPPDPVFQLPFPLFFQNNLDARTHGVELSINYQVLDWWRLHGGATLLREEVRVRPGRTDFNHALNETADPRQQFSLRSSMDLPHRFELDVGLRSIGSRQINNNGTAAVVPGYSELDIRLGWHATENLELSIVGQNLLHDHHLEYGVPRPTRAEIKRGVYGKVTWRY